MSYFEEINAGCKNAPHLRLLNSEADARQGNDPRPRMPYPLAIDAKHEVRSLTNPVFDGKVWSSTGFKPFASAKTANDLPPLSSSWIQRLKPASHRTRLQDGHDMKDMCIDMKTNTNQCGTPAPLYENSRRNKQDFYSSPYAVVASDQYSRALMTATSRSMEGAKVPQVPQPQVYVAPRFLPIVEALLPSYSQKANAGPFATEKANLGNEVKQFSADERPKVSCSSIKAADFRSSFRSPSVRRHSSTLRSKYDREFGKEYYTEKGIIGASPIGNKFSFGEKGIEESITNYACHDNMVLMKYKAMSEEIQADDFSCYQMHVLDANKVCESQRKQPGICLSFNVHVAENALSCQRLEPRNSNLTEYSIQENGHSSFGTIREAHSSESLLDCRSPCKLPYDCEATFESAEKRFCGNRNVSFHKAVQGDFIVSKTNNGTGAGADDGGHGVHCFAKPPESGYKADCAKEEETGHMHALQRQSDWRNWMGYKSCVRGMASAREFPDLGSLPGPPTTKPYHGGLDEATGSYSDSCEKIEGGILPTLNEKTRLPDGHLLPLVLRKRSWDHDKEPLSNEFCEEESHAKHKLWMQRWCTASPEQHPNVNRELKTFVGISPFSEGGDGARTGSILFSSDSFALRPAKPMCHGSLQYTSRKVLSGFQTARQYDADKTSFHFMKRFFNPSAAAMAIVGTTAREIHVADPQRKGLFGTWAAPKPSTGTIPLAEDETCKHFEDIVHKSLKKSLPRM